MHSVTSLSLRRGDSGNSTSQPPRRKSFTFPERFQEGDDADIDVTAPRSRRARYMNHSFLSMIANVGSNTAPESQTGLEGGSMDGQAWSTMKDRKDASRSLVAPDLLPTQKHEQKASDGAVSEHSLSRLTQSTPGFGSRPRSTNKKNKSPLAALQEDMSSSQILPPKDTQPSAGTRTDREARDNEHPAIQEADEEHSALESSTESTRSSSSSAPSSHHAMERRADLASRVAEVFGFAEPENIVTGQS